MTTVRFLRWTGFLALFCVIFVQAEQPEENSDIVDPVDFQLLEDQLFNRLIEKGDGPFEMKIKKLLANYLLANAVESVSNNVSLEGKPELELRQQQPGNFPIPPNCQYQATPQQQAVPATPLDSPLDSIVGETASSPTQNTSVPPIQVLQPNPPQQPSVPPPPAQQSSPPPIQVVYIPPATSAPILPIATLRPRPSQEHIYNQVHRVLDNVAVLNVTGIVDQALGIRANNATRTFVTGILNTVFCNPINRLLGRCRG